MRPPLRHHPPLGAAASAAGVLGQPVVVENRPGDGGTLAADPCPQAHRHPAAATRAGTQA